MKVIKTILSKTSQDARVEFSFAPVQELHTNTKRKCWENYSHEHSPEASSSLNGFLSMLGMFLTNAFSSQVKM
jgi:hypothetical protein